MSPQEKYDLVLNRLVRPLTIEPPPLFDPTIQQQLLGSFNRPEIELPLIGLNLDLKLLGTTRAPLKSSQHIISKLDSIKGTSECYYGAIVGVAGCGKTTTIYDVAMKYYVVYIECGAAAIRDTNFISLVDRISDLYWSKIGRKRFGHMATLLIKRHLLARLLYLRAVFNCQANLSPLEYLNAQLNLGKNIIVSFEDELESTSHRDLSDLLQYVSDDLRSNFLRERPLVVAIDAANVAITKIFHGHFRSSNGHPRGLLTPLTSALMDTCVQSVLWAGSAMSMVHAETIQSDIGKSKILDIIIDKFEPENKPQQWIERYIDTSGCEDVWKDPTVPSHELIGRMELSGSVISSIPRVASGRTSKSEILGAAIVRAVKTQHDTMHKKLLTACQHQQDMCKLVADIIIAAALCHDEVYFPPPTLDHSSDEKDLVYMGICQLVWHNGSVRWKLADPLAVRVCCEVLHEIDPNGTQLPDWLHKIKFHLARYGTASELGFENDMEYFNTLVQHTGLLAALALGQKSLPAASHNNNADGGGGGVTEPTKSKKVSQKKSDDKGAKTTKP